MIGISKYEFNNPRFQNILSRRQGMPPEVVGTVSRIIDDVRENGDKALREYMKKYDGVDIDEIGLMATEEEFEEAKRNMPPEFVEAVRKACRNLFRFHREQIPSGFSLSDDDGVVLERKYVPLSRIAVTVPGNMAPLFSTLYMNLVPAIVAEVPEIYIITKPGKDGRINDYILFVADCLNVRNVYKISGAQGIAAVAFGTDSVKKVDAVVGPGNIYTQTAKKLLFGSVRIDSIAGPSEIAIIADEKANPRYVAADLLSQAEHGTGYEACTAFCLSFDQAESIKRELVSLMEKYSLGNTEKALKNYGDIFVVDSLDTAIEAVNMIAPEHVEVLVSEPEHVVDRIRNAGAIFVGAFSPEPVGDYFCGTNHVLPTCGTARFSSGLSVLDFMRGYSIINYTREALVKNAHHISELAKTEGMRAHQLAVDVRTES